MNDHHTHRSWRRKFADAFRGVALGVRGQSSFFVHFSVAVAVGLAAAVLQVSRIGWCVLAICIAAVLTAEMFNSALERLARAVDPSFNPHVAAALDIASAAVLLSAIGASSVGIVIFLPRIVTWWQGG